MADDEIETPEDAPEADAAQETDAAGIEGDASADVAPDPIAEQAPNLNRFSSDVPKEEKEGKKRNLKSKEILASLDDEGDEFGGLYEDEADDGKKGKKRKKKQAGEAKVPFLKKNKGLIITVGVVAFLGFAYYMLTRPRIGSIPYGICKVMLERSVQYPHSLRISTVKELGKSVRIWYVQTDSFGQYRMEPIQCYFDSTPERGFFLEKVTINRRDIDRQEIDSFNKIIGTIRVTETYLHIPPPLPDKLSGLKVEVFTGLGL